MSGSSVELHGNATSGCQFDDAFADWFVGVARCSPCHSDRKRRDFDASNVSSTNTLRREASPSRTARWGSPVGRSRICACGKGICDRGRVVGAAHLRDGVACRTAASARRAPAAAPTRRDRRSRPKRRSPDGTAASLLPWTVVHPGRSRGRCRLFRGPAAETGGRIVVGSAAERS